tara:strand:+ start:108 stop:1475 length:1368 start_codon:yes stop_codon:yes gene_type:complete
MKNFIYLLFITLLCSCGGSDEGSDSKFNSHQETLNVFNEIMIDENIVSKNKNSVEYSFKSEEGDYFKSINISVESEKKRESERLFSRNIEGDFTLGTHDTGGLYQCYINFYLPKGENLTVENILKYNELDFRRDFIRLKHSVESNSGRISVKKSLLKTGVNIINNNGIISKDNKYYDGEEDFYFKSYVQDTIEYSKMVNGLKEGKYFKKNIVSYYDRSSKKGPKLFDDSIVKYIEEEGSYTNDRKTGKWIIRNMGIVESKTIYENGRVISKITYGEVSLSGPDSLFKVIGRGSQGKFLWSNQDKFKIDEDSKGYKSYTPNVIKIENIKGFENQYGNLDYKRHGKYEENSFTGDYFSFTSRFIPRIRANYNQGSLDGNFIEYDYNGKETMNLEYKNGKLIKGVVNVYWDDYLQKSHYKSEDGTYNFKTYDSNGIITDEGIEKKGHFSDLPIRNQPL